MHCSDSYKSLAFVAIQLNNVYSVRCPKSAKCYVPLGAGLNAFPCTVFSCAALGFPTTVNADNNPE